MIMKVFVFVMMLYCAIGLGHISGLVNTTKEWPIIIKMNGLDAFLAVILYLVFLIWAARLLF